MATFRDIELILLEKRPSGNKKKWKPLLEQVYYYLYIYIFKINNNRCGG